jgi:prepilin-type N-terminal cleavage/methylation domain-containing protein
MAERGFTLVEVLVSLAILAVGLLALAKLASVNMRAGTRSHQASEATVLAQDKMEQLRRYATGDQPGTFAVYGFDYLTSTGPAFTSVVDPPGSTATPPPTVTVAGLLSGNNGGVSATTTGGTTYEVLYDDGSHGDAAAADGVYSASDRLYYGQGISTTGSGHAVERVWSVQPITSGGRTDFAKLTVHARWSDVQGDHEFHLESLAHRRQ